MKHLHQIYKDDYFHHLPLGHAAKLLRTLSRDHPANGERIGRQILAENPEEMIPAFQMLLENMDQTRHRPEVRTLKNLIAAAGERVRERQAPPQVASVVAPSSQIAAVPPKIQPAPVQEATATIPSSMMETVTCPICTEVMKEASATECGHSFCDVCIKRCLKNKKECPICRKKITDTLPNYTLRNLLPEMLNAPPEAFPLEQKETPTNVEAQASVANNANNRESDLVLLNKRFIILSWAGLESGLVYFLNNENIIEDSTVNRVLNLYSIESRKDKAAILYEAFFRKSQENPAYFYKVLDYMKAKGKYYEPLVKRLQ